MFGNRPWRTKLGPSLYRVIASPTAAASGTRPLQIIVAGRRRAIRSLVRNEDTALYSESVPFAVLSLATRSIPRIAKCRGVVALELDDYTVLRRSPRKTARHAVPNVYRSYKTERLAELDGDGTKLHILDTGVGKHSHLPAAISVDCTGSGHGDRDGHGTAIVGQAIARGPFPGLVPNARVTSARVFDDKSRAKSSYILRAFSHALDASADVVSMSWGALVSDPVIEFGIKELYRKNVVLVAAAGNEGPEENTITWPARYSEVIAVAATNVDGSTATFSSRGSRSSPAKPDLAAEGVNVPVVRLRGSNFGTPYTGYRSIALASGTSFSAPIVACLCCMIRQAKGSIPPRKVTAHLKDSCRRK